MNTGIQDGYNLAWKLALVCKGKASEKLLDTYNEERLPNAHRLLKTTDRFFEFGLATSGLYRIFALTSFRIFWVRVKSRHCEKGDLSVVSQIAICYRDSSLSVSDTDFAIKAGDRIAVFRVGHSIYDELREPKFHVIAFGGNGAGKLDDRFKELVDKHTLPLSDDIAEHFGADQPFIVVLRPDNYIGLITTDCPEKRSAIISSPFSLNFQRSIPNRIARRCRERRCLLARSVGACQETFNVIRRRTVMSCSVTCNRAFEPSKQRP